MNRIKSARRPGAICPDCLTPPLDYWKKPRNLDRLRYDCREIFDLQWALFVKENSLSDFAKALRRGACVIGEAKAEPRGIVVLETVFGGTRIVDMLVVNRRRKFVSVNDYD